MVVDILDSLVVSRKFSRITSPTTAVYFSILVEIIKGVMRNAKFDPTTGEFRLDRKYIELETGIERSEQLNSDEQLVKLGIIKVSETDKDKIAINMNRYFSLLADEKLSAENILSKGVKKTREQKKLDKEAGIVNHIVDSFSEPDDEVRSKLTTLVFAYMRKCGMVSKYQWQPVIDQISKTAKTKTEKIQLIDYILLKNWVSIGSVIEDYQQKHKVSSGTRLNTTDNNICTKISEDIKF